VLLLLLLLAVQVAGQSGEVLGHSRSFSSLLGQLLDLSVADLDTQPDVTRLQTLQQVGGVLVAFQVIVFHVFDGGRKVWSSQPDVTRLLQVGGACLFLFVTNRVVAASL
jgi:hypothetical protein